MIDPYRLYYQESIKRQFTTGSNHPNLVENGSPNQSRKKKEGSEQLNVNAHQDSISASLKTPPPTPSPPSSITASQRHNIVKSLNKRPSMTKRLEKTARIPKSKAVKASMNSSQHQRQHSSQQLHTPHMRRHYKEKRSSSYASITKSTTRSRKAPLNNSLRLSYSNSNSMKNLNRAMASIPPFDKDILDTFCFHWPAMHCYVLVRILPRSIAILPIRTRLAFLYFCHAPRPRQPSIQDLHQQQLHGRRIQSMFKSWKHTLAFNDSSSSSTSSDDDDHGDHHSTTASQGQHTLGVDRPIPTKKVQQRHTLTKKDSSIHLNDDDDQHQHQQHSHSHHTQQHHHHHHHHHQHQRSHHHPHHHHANRARTDPGKPTTHRHTSSKDNLTKTQPSKHRRQRSAVSSSTTIDEGDAADYYSKEGHAVTLSDVLKDHRTGDVCWIHAPCKIQTPASIDNDNNFVTLQSRRTTLELKARCYSEKKMFMNLFKLNRLVYTASRKPCRPSKQQQQHRNITETDLIQALEIQNDKLQTKISQLYDQMQHWQQDILHYEEQCGVMDEKLDTTMAVVQHHKEHHVDYEELTDTMVATRQELKSHMADFHKTHQRILDQHAGHSGGSLTWVIEKSFQRLYRFQDRHSTQHGPATLSISLVIGLIVLLLAAYIGYHYT